MSGRMRLQGRSVLLRPVEETDVQALARIVREPEVAAWWAPPERFDGMLAIVVDGEVAGAIQYHEEDDPDYRHASIDLFLAARFQGRGHGTDAVRTLGRWLVVERGHHRLTIDPAAANDAAIRAYEKVGFKRVGVLREYERDPRTGAWRDGLLMDLLASDLAADDP